METSQVTIHMTPSHLATVNPVSTVLQQSSHISGKEVIKPLFLWMAAPGPPILKKGVPLNLRSGRMEEEEIGMIGEYMTLPKGVDQTKELQG